MDWLKQKIKHVFNFNPLDWFRLIKLQYSLRHSKLPSRNAKGTALVWFTYAGDINLLAASIKSVDLFVNTAIDHLVIVQDSSAPFSIEQISELTSLSHLPLTLINSLSPLGWAGVSTITSELDAYQTIFSELEVEWLVKIDSDALTISNRIFEKLATLPKKPLLVGQSAKALYQNHPTFSYADWAQGGCYCLNKMGFEAMKNVSLIRTALNTLHIVPMTLKDLPEDVFISQLAKLAKVDVYYLNFHYPVWLRDDLNAPLLQNQAQYDYSILHFEGCKAHQEDTLLELILHSKPQTYLDKQWQLKKKKVTFQQNYLEK